MKNLKNIYIYIYINISNSFNIIANDSNQNQLVGYNCEVFILYCS